MKRVFALATTLSVLFMGCNTQGGSGSQAFAPNKNDMPASGATTYAASLSDVFMCLGSLQSDMVVTDLAGSVNGKTAIDSSQFSAGAAEKINAANSAVSSGQARSAVSAGLDLSGETFGKYVSIEQGTLNYKLSVKSKNSNLVELITIFKQEDPSTLGACSLEANGTVLLKGINLPNTSGIKYFVAYANGNGLASVSGAEKSTDAEVKVNFLNLALSGEANVALGCSVNSKGLGGKIVITANAVEDAKVANTSTLKGKFESLLPTKGGAVSISVFDDNNQPVYQENWDSVSEFIVSLKAIMAN